MVVDLWGGWADEARAVPWTENTITTVLSTNTTITALVLVDRGELDLDANVAIQGLALMPARLVALDGGPDILLDGFRILVGRHPKCDAQLTSMRVSRRHCCITLANGEVEVVDLGSTNGILINGRQTQCGRLRPGDVLWIAHLRYRLD